MRVKVAGIGSFTIDGSIGVDALKSKVSSQYCVDTDALQVFVSGKLVGDDDIIMRSKHVFVKRANKRKRRIVIDKKMNDIHYTHYQNNNLK